MLFLLVQVFYLFNAATLFLLLVTLFKCLSLLYPTVRVSQPYIRLHEVCGAFGGLIVLLEQVAFSVYLQLLLVCCKILVM